MLIAQRSRLCSRLGAVVAGLSILILVPGVSLAKENDQEKDKGKGQDYCITFPGHAVFELVGQGFSIPDPGKCAPWTGFFITSVNSPSTSAGTGCTATDGSDLEVTITSSRQGIVFIDGIILSLPAQTGADEETSIGVFPGQILLPAAGAPCSDVAIPAASPPPVGP